MSTLESKNAKIAFTVSENCTSCLSKLFFYINLHNILEYCHHVGGRWLFIRKNILRGKKNKNKGHYCSSLPE